MQGREEGREEWEVIVIKQRQCEREGKGKVGKRGKERDREKGTFCQSECQFLQTGEIFLKERNDYTSLDGFRETLGMKEHQ